MRERRIALAFAAAALAFGLAMVFVTPPFQVPDEVGHYWHTYAIVGGTFVPAAAEQKLEIPKGARDLVWHLWVAPGTEENFSDRMARAREVPYSAERVGVRYRGFYSPLPYLPQAIACGAGELMRLRPIVTFYSGRIANLLCAVTLIAVAIALAEEVAWPLAAAGLLPMALFLFASFSADAVTIALAFLTTALARRGHKALAPVAFLLGLCKPPYLLISALALGARRRGAVIAIVAALAGAAIALPFERGVSNARPEANAGAQMERLIHQPAAVAGAIATDVWTQGSEYLDQLVGRLGWLDVRLPRIAYYACLLMLVSVAAAGGTNATMTERLTAAAIVVVCVVFIELSQFVAWTPPGSARLEGVQGRYFLPLLPIALIAISRRGGGNRRVAAVAIAVGATVANTAAIFVMMRRYFG